MVPSPSPLDKTQWKSVLKALIYSFTAGFTGSLVLQSADVIKAVHDGRSAVTHLAISVITGAVIGGINAIAFFLEKLFTTTGSGA